MAAKGGFRVGQTAKARRGRRVQSLPIGTWPPLLFLMNGQRHRARNQISRRIIVGNEFTTSLSFQSALPGANRLRYARELCNLAFGAH